MKLRWPLQRLGVAGRLYLGFGLLVMVMVALAMAAQQDLLRAERAQQQLQIATEHERQMLELRDRLGELQRNVKLFSYAGHGALAKRARAGLLSLEEALSEAQARGRDELNIKLFERLRGHIAAYKRNLEFAFEERELRRRLVQVQVPEQEAELEQQIRSGELGSGAPLVRAFAQVRLRLSRYLIDPEFRLLEQSAATLRRLPPGPGRSALERYYRSFTRIVQATRGYLFLINVVSAGEALEFNHTVRALAAHERARVVRLRAEVQAGNRRAKQVRFGIALAALLLALALARRIGRSVTVPLAAIATTLERLAQGAQGITVPGTERQDEIGSMARAANVFREKNEQTAQLLEETRRLADSLDAHKRDLERSHGELEEFVHTVSHDLKSPVVTSAGFLGMMRELHSQGRTEEAFAKLDRLERANQRMSQLITDLLDLSRVGRTDTEQTELSVEAIVEELASTLRLRFPEADLRVGSLPDARGNPTRVTQVFENLLENALKYAGPQARVEVTGERAGGVIRYRVSDDGPGILPEHHARVFGLFQRLGTQTNSTGVGLAIVARVMALHGGCCGVDSEGNGEGATFWLDFPAEQASAVAGIASAA